MGILTYYPLSAYTMPNFQFAEKTLDPQYKPTYKVLLAQITLPSLSTPDIQSIELLLQSLNILSLLTLTVCVRVMEPCLIKWFNYIETLVIMVGLVWNIMGLVWNIMGHGVDSLAH